MHQTKAEQNQAQNIDYNSIFEFCQLMAEFSFKWKFTNEVVPVKQPIHWCMKFISPVACPIEYSNNLKVAVVSHQSASTMEIRFKMPSAAVYNICIYIIFLIWLNCLSDYNLKWKKKINKRIFIVISITFVRHVFFSTCSCSSSFVSSFSRVKKRNGNEWA